MEIIVYNDTYKNQIIDLILDIQCKEFNVPITINDQPDLQNISKYYLGNNGSFWIAIQDGKVIGTIATLFLKNENAVIRKLFTDGNYRGKEFQTGLRLLETLESFCFERGKKRIYLGTTSKFKAAQRFYEKNGYIEIAKDDLPDDFDIMAVDSKFYCKCLNNGVLPILT